MRYTPVELRHVKVGRSLLGYRRADMDRLLEDIADSFEEVWCDRGELADKVEDLTKQLDDFKARESLLANTLISAEKAAAEAKELARKEAELAISEAHQEARSITRSALTERERLFAEARRVETLLRSALGMVEEVATSHEEVGDAPSGPQEHWPKREDTREFEAVSLPAAPVAEADASGEDQGEGTPLPPPLPPSAEHEPEAEQQPEGDQEQQSDQEPHVEVPWTGKDFTWG
jgi:cell division septum initiation protein DivIVA